MPKCGATLARILNSRLTGAPEVRGVNAGWRIERLAMLSPRPAVESEMRALRGVGRPTRTPGAATSESLGGASALAIVWRDGSRSAARRLFGDHGGGAGLALGAAARRHVAARRAHDARGEPGAAAPALRVARRPRRVHRAGVRARRVGAGDGRRPAAVRPVDARAAVRRSCRHGELWPCLVEKRWPLHDSYAALRRLVRRAARPRRRAACSSRAARLGRRRGHPRRRRPSPSTRAARRAPRATRSRSRSTAASSPGCSTVLQSSAQAGAAAPPRMPVGRQRQRGGGGAAADALAPGSG